MKIQKPQGITLDKQLSMLKGALDDTNKAETVEDLKRPILALIRLGMISNSVWSRRKQAEEDNQRGIKFANQVLDDEMRYGSGDS